jgi:predicted hotdog family 3-hydroxylacyl-ACP dehydratase
MVKTVLNVDVDTVSCEIDVDNALTPFCKNGALPAEFIIEMCAQTVGVWAGWHDHAAGVPPQSGLLLGCRGFSCDCPALPVGTRLRIDAEKLTENGGTGSFECRVFKINTTGDTVQIATATLTTHKTTWDNLRKLLKR